MLYMPATTNASPMVLQETQQSPLQASTRYYMLQSAPVIPAVPIFNTTYVYPRYGFVPKPVETSLTKEDIEKSQPTQIIEVAQPVQHVIHHHVQPCSMKTCPGYCELCCPWITQSTHHHCNASSYDNHQQQRYSRRDEYERDELNYIDPSKQETIDEKIERIRRELGQSSLQQSGTSPTFDHHIHPRSRSNSRPRSASTTRDPWRSSNQNEYEWRDAHLPAYRDATLARAQTPADESHTWKETAHARSHKNTQHPTSYYSKKDYVYQPKSETEARKWYTQTTGKDPDREVYQALRGGTTTYNYTGSSGSYYDKHQGTTYDHSSNSNVPTTTKTHSLRKIDSTQHHNLYACNEPCLHVIPKQGSASDPPYVKILNAPITYLH